MSRTVSETRDKNYYTLSNVLHCVTYVHGPNVPHGGYMYGGPVATFNSEQLAEEFAKWLADLAALNPTPPPAASAEKQE